jgi:hypothetical protein
MKPDMIPVPNRREIPHTQHLGGQVDDLDDSVYCHNHRWDIIINHVVS